MDQDSQADLQPDVKPERSHCRSGCRRILPPASRWSSGSARSLWTVAALLNPCFRKISVAQIPSRFHAPACERAPLIRCISLCRGALFPAYVWKISRLIPGTRSQVRNPAPFAGAGHGMDKCRVHHVAGCSVLIALVTAFIRPSNPRFHPSFYIDHCFPEGVIDHPLNRRIAA